MTDLAFFAVAVYGCAWTLTKSKLLARFRDWTDTEPPHRLRGLVHCIVCTSAWVGLALGALHNWASVPGLSIRTPVDALFVVGFSIGATWLVARVTGDAD